MKINYENIFYVLALFNIMWSICSALEQVALNRLVEMAYKKQLVSISSVSIICSFLQTRAFCLVTGSLHIHMILGLVDGSFNIYIYG